MSLLLQRSQGKLGMTWHWCKRRTMTMMKMPLLLRRHPVWCDVFGALWWPKVMFQTVFWRAPKFSKNLPKNHYHSGLYWKNYWLVYGVNMAVLSMRYFRLPPWSSWDCCLPGNYAACRGNSLLTFRYSLSVPSSRAKEGITTTCCIISQKSRSHLLCSRSLKSRIVNLYGETTLRHIQWFESHLGFLTLEDGTDRLSRNVGKELPLHATYYPRRAQVSVLSSFWFFTIGT